VEYKLNTSIILSIKPIFELALTANKAFVVICELGAVGNDVGWTVSTYLILIVKVLIDQRIRGG